MAYKIVHKRLGWVMAHCDTAHSAAIYLYDTLPRMIARGYLMDKTATADDFEIQGITCKKPK